ncbi:MoaD/ThiS family protein [bacterium]|nr:MoaD/ThiS family protein [bacterium]
MAVKVTLTGRLSDVLGKQLFLSSPKTVREAIKEIASLNEEGAMFLLDENGEIRDNVIVLRNEENVEDFDGELNDGDELFILLPIAGG